MKKFSLFLLMPIILAGCAKKPLYDDYSKWTIIAPTGAPAIAMSYFSDLTNFQTNSDSQNILASMINGKADLAVLPTNVGIQAIKQKNLPYKLLGTLTHGNIYIASTGNDSDGIMGADDYIVSFQKGAVPDKIFHYVYDNTLDNALHYVSSAQEAAKCLKMGINLVDDNKTVDYVVIAEPAFTTVLNSAPNVTQYADLQELYKAKSNGLGIYQAGLFCKIGLDNHTIMEPIRGNLRKSNLEMIENPEKVFDFMNKNSNPEATFGVKPEIAKLMFQRNNRMNIEYKDAIEQIDGINLFLSLFGVEPINEEDTLL